MKLLIIETEEKMSIHRLFNQSFKTVTARLQLVQFLQSFMKKSVVSFIFQILVLITVCFIIPSQQIYAQTLGTLWTPVHNLIKEVVSTDLSQQPYRPYGTIAADINGAVHIFLPVQIGNCLDTLYYWRYDGSWTHPVDILAAPPGQCMAFPEAVIDSHGTIHLFWMQDNQLLYSRSSAWEANSPH